MRIFNGLAQLLECKKAVMCLIVFAGSLYANLKGHIDGTSLAAIVVAIIGLYEYTSHKLDIKSLENKNAK